jgi:hypothetical protein
VLGGEGTSNVEQFITEKRERLKEEPLLGTYNWYVTISLARVVEFDDSSIAEHRYFLSRHADTIGDDLKEYARPYLDIAATIAATIFDPRVFDELVLDDRVLFFPEGKEPSGLPVFGGSVELTVSRGEPSSEQLTRRLDLLRQLRSRDVLDAEWVGSISHWRLQALTEKDPWKKFLAVFLCLEILANKLFAKYRDEVVARLRLDDLAVPGLPIGELVWDKNRTPLSTFRRRCARPIPRRSVRRCRGLH